MSALLALVQRMTEAGEHPVAVIQWPVGFVDREWPLWGKSNAR
jgi:precorrin isomerase